MQSCEGWAQLTISVEIRQSQLTSQPRRRLHRAGCDSHAATSVISSQTLRPASLSAAPAPDTSWIKVAERTGCTEFRKEWEEESAESWRPSQDAKVASGESQSRDFCQSLSFIPIACDCCLLFLRFVCLGSGNERIRIAFLSCSTARMDHMPRHVNHRALFGIARRVQM